MDTLEITGLKIRSTIGIHAWEQKIKQPLLIDLKIMADFSGCDDKIENTIDYDALCQDLSRFLESRPFLLIDTVADELLKRLQEHLQQSKIKASELYLSVSKPTALKNVGNIRLTRHSQLDK